MIYIGIMLFVVGVSFGAMLTVWLFTYLINRCDVWISPDAYIRKKILKKRAMITGVNNGNGRIGGVAAERTRKKGSMGQDGRRKKEALSRTGAEKKGIV